MQRSESKGGKARNNLVTREATPATGVRTVVDSQCMGDTTGITSVTGFTAEETETDDASRVSSLNAATGLAETYLGRVEHDLYWRGGSKRVTKRTKESESYCEDHYQRRAIEAGVHTQLDRRAECGENKKKPEDKRQARRSNDLQLQWRCPRVNCRVGPRAD
ncbi:hypothetical protein K438DRAFT_1789221 [Mycena galopus ATCC 62051]|nr:hypothetical protein K438DRAFT_1789221 [Mycena galopus ATCC 62051]